MPINFNANNVQPAVNTNAKPAEANADKKSEKPDTMKTVAVATGAGAAALAAVGVYIASKGKVRAKADGMLIKNAAEAAGFKDVNLYRDLRKIKDIKLEAREKLTLEDVIYESKEYVQHNYKPEDEVSFSIFKGDEIKDILEKTNKDKKGKVPDIPENAMLMCFSKKNGDNIEVDKQSLRLVVPESIDDGLKELFENGNSVSLT